MAPFIAPLQHSPRPQTALQNSAEAQLSGPFKTAQRQCIGKQAGSDRSHDEPASKRRQVSLADEVHRLTLTAPPVPGCEPDSALVESTVTARSSRPASTVADRRVLKVALRNLSNDVLSPADFIALVNHFGYHTPLHNFPCSTLQPSAWLALKERARLQILQCHPCLLAQLAPEAVTCDICLSVYMQREGEMLSLVPGPLKNSFFTKLIERHPWGLLDIPACERTFEHLLQACCANSELLDKLSDRERTAELVTEVFQRTGYGLAYIEEQQRSYDLCLRACKTNGMALEHVPQPLKNNELCRVALTMCGQAYRWLPEELSKSYQWQLLACQKDGAALKWIAKDLHDNDLLEAACRNRWEALMFIDKDRITYQMCCLALVHCPILAYEYIPDHHMDETMRWRICSTTYDRGLCERVKPNTANFYTRLLQENPKASLLWIPEEDRTDEHYLLACQNSGSDLKLVPEQYRTEQICFAACRNYGLALQWVPKQLRTEQLCLAACRNNGLALQWVPKQQRTDQICQVGCKKSIQAYQYVAKEQVELEWFVEALHDDRCNNPSMLLTYAKRLLPAADFQSLLERSFLCTNNHKMTMLTHAQVSPAQKSELTEWMLEPSDWPTPEEGKNSDLCEMASPLRFTLQNPELKHLARAAMKVAAHWLPPRYGAGQRLLDAIWQVRSSSSVVLPDHSEPLLQTRGTIVSGRTLKIDQGTEALYYKFQRKGESLNTLMQEGILHTVRERHPELFGQLHSKLPSATRFFRLYLDQLPEDLRQFGDPLAIAKDESNRCYVHVYRYIAGAEYNVYAHHADHSQPSNPWHKGEQGLLTACHDIGQFVAMGLVPTSTLPAFHDSVSGRQWMALHALLGYTDRTVYPGTFGAWNSVATEHCDFGYGGFRDVGDFEAFGEIESFTKRVDARNSLQAAELEQCLSLVNAVCENLIAVHLIRARLRQQGCDYHYQNPEALQQTKTFIEQSFLSFLKGLYSDCMQSDSDRSFLLARLELDEPAYERWLARTAVEILYWTAKQPHPARPDLPPFADNDLTFSHHNGYALHLNRTGRLDPELYPDDKPEGRQTRLYPDHFQNLGKRLNLGRNNSVFPLTTLMRGLTRLCTGILTYDQRRHARPELSQQ